MVADYKTIGAGETGKTGLLITISNFKIWKRLKSDDLELVSVFLFYRQVLPIYRVVVAQWKMMKKKKSGQQKWKKWHALY
jgi:hypothetical protein